MSRSQFHGLSGSDSTNDLGVDTDPKFAKNASLLELEHTTHLTKQTPGWPGQQRPQHARCSKGPGCRREAHSARLTSQASKIQH